MTKKAKRNEIVFPDGDFRSDFIWASRMARRDLALFWEGNEGRLLDALHTLSEKLERTDLEKEYLRSVLYNPHRDF